jgi:hypothetical protein
MMQECRPRHVPAFSPHPKQRYAIFGVLPDRNVDLVQEGIDVALRMGSPATRAGRSRYFAAGGAMAADWLLRSSASATKPEAFTSSTNAAK